MHLSQPPTLLSLLFTILSTTHTINARPNAPRELLESQYHYLSERGCAGTVCGWNGQLCCTGGQLCTTNAQNQAECVSGSSSPQQANVQQANANGQWQYFVTTFVESELTTITSTYSSVLNAASTAAAAPAISGISCDTSMHESPCGTECCAVGQYCAYAGQCQASNDQGGSSTYGASFTATVAPSTATAFIRPISSAATTITSTGSATTTVPFGTPTSTASSAPGMAATSSNNGLSGGAIAGIVIGVIAGIILLLALCACFCAKGIIDGILDFFGLRSRRRREETYIEERRTHHANGGGRTWYGGRINPSRVDRPKKKSNGIGGLGWVAGLLAALALCLGLQRKRQERREKTEYTGSSYSYSDYTSESEC